MHACMHYKALILSFDNLHHKNIKNQNTIKKTSFIQLKTKIELHVFTPFLQNYVETI